MPDNSLPPTPRSAPARSDGLPYSVMAGLVCGVAATGPMTAAMILGHRVLPPAQQYPLPPQEITARTLEPALDERDERLPLLTLGAHFAYGGLAGALYGVFAKHRGSVTQAGVGLGALVWSLSYLGLLPAAGVLRNGLRHPLRRSLLMLAAHFVWGLALAGLHRLLVTDHQRATPALRTGQREAQD